MDLRLIEQSLPNGFHDAYLSALDLDLVHHDVELSLSVLVANDDQPVSERYKQCRLTLRDYSVLVLEPAIAYREIKPSRGLQIDQTQLNEEDYQAFRQVGYNMREGNFWLALFVYDWNSRIIINARDADLNFL
jgi:hypothetical protein